PSLVTSTDPPYNTKLPNSLQIKPLVRLEDSRNISLKNNSVDIIVTSPPYGEERSTMPYTTFSKLSLLWLGYKYEDILTAMRQSLGAKTKKEMFDLPSDTLQETIKKINNEKRSRDVLSFFFDYYAVLKELHRVLKRNGFCCIVIGNRTVRKVPIPNNKITIELAESLGFREEITYLRTHPKKVLPRNDGRVNLINKESIIVLKK
ncbi:MAG: DNA methyltransferase, partial [Methanosarcinales archaeon]